jgi:hypothetical protein
MDTSLRRDYCRRPTCPWFLAPQTIQKGGPVQPLHCTARRFRRAKEDHNNCGHIGSFHVQNSSLEMRICLKPYKDQGVSERECAHPYEILYFLAVFRIRIPIFLGLMDPDPDPLVRGMDPDPDPSIIKQK